MAAGPLFWVATLCLAGADRPEVLTTAGAVRELTPEQAGENRPVRLTATVTLANSVPNDLFVQDETTGIYVMPIPDVSGLAPGDRVEVVGVTNPGTFAPCINASMVRKIGQGALPEPEPHSLDPEDNRWLDSRYIQAWVYVQDLGTIGGYVRLGVTTARGSARVYVAESEASRRDAAALVGRIVRVRGVCTSPRHDPRTRTADPIGRIHLQSLADVEVARGTRAVTPVPIVRAARGFVPGPAPFAQPAAVSGVVTFALDARGEQLLAVQDETAAAWVRLSSPAALRVGDPAIVTGYLDRHTPGVTLVNASARRASDPLPLPDPVVTTADHVGRGGRWASLVRVVGVTDSVTHQEGELLVKCHDGPNRFLAVLATDATPEWVTALEPGTRVAVVGVCSPVGAGGGDHPDGFRVHLRSLADLAVLDLPPPTSWWTGRRIRNLGLGIGAAVVLAVAWILLLRRQVRRQTAEVRAHFERAVALERSLQEHRRLEAIGRLVSGITHDFNNLLTVLVGGGEFAAAALPDDHPAAGWVRSMRLAAERAADLSRQLLTFARERPIVLVQVNLNGVIGEAEDLVRRTVGEHIRVVGDYATNLPIVLADPGLVTQIILNLAANGRDAMPGGGELVFRTSREDDGGAVVARVSVSDTGSGIDEATQARIFEPFFTTKEFGKGTGLGLATVYGIVRHLGGTIRVRSALGKGTTFTIDLPEAVVAKDDPPENAAAVPVAAAATSLLLVDDDDGVRMMCEAALVRYGYQVVSSGVPEQALELARATPAGFTLLVTDARMPGMSGPELAAQVREAHPGIRVLVMSGYPREEVPHAELLLPSDVFLQKPFTPMHLAGQVHALLRGE